MKFYHFRFITIFILTSARILASGDSLLVKIGPSGITADEFQQRFELIPQVSGGAKNDLEQRKSDLLYSLIAEKLWAYEAEALKLDNSDIMQITFKTIEKMFVRDALYKIEIADKIKITYEDKLEGLKRISFVLDLDVLHFADSASAKGIYELLKNGITFDSAKSIMQSNLPAIQIKFGELRESVENVLYNLNEGEFTAPIKSSSGWLIFNLLKKEPAAFEKREQALMNAEEIIKQRKTDNYYDEFYGKFFSSKKVETDGALFWRIADKITDRLYNKKIVDSIPDSENIYLAVNDLLSIEQELGTDTLNMRFIKLDGSPLSVKQFLREFIFDGFYSANVSPNVISAKLNSRVKTFIEQELLAREGYKRGLQNLPEVKSSISMWRDNYLAKILKNMLVDSIKITDEEVYNYYSKKSGIGDSSLIEVNILEILTDSLEIIESVLYDLERGEDFRKIASLHTKRTWTRNNGGEFGFFPVTMYGEIGRIAAQMNIGEIYGPIKLPEGYSVFTLINKRAIGIDTTLSLEESKEEIRKNLAYKKSANFFIDYTVKLANKYGVYINEQLFRLFEVSDMNLIVYRYMGFGGRINAVPMAIPFTEWFLPWKESKKLVP
jgi:parvulin-like peptidyl-prolyl isomerase